MKDFSFPGIYRIKRSSEFVDIQGDNSKLYSRSLLILFRHTEQPFSRLGIVVSRKVDKKAVIRNRIKRHIREIFRHEHDRFTQSIDMVVIARAEAVRSNLWEIRKDFTYALKKGGVLK